MTHSIPVSGSADDEDATEKPMRITSARHRIDLIVPSPSRLRFALSTDWGVKPGVLDTAKTGPVPECFKSFHEKAGRCQDGFIFFLSEVFFRLSRAASVAILPSVLFGERIFFARCKLGVLHSTGAAT
jgi:hypothetical protein